MGNHKGNRRLCFHFLRKLLMFKPIQLLEERDTLQLRLSNALRQNHEMQQQQGSSSAPDGAGAATPTRDLTDK